MELCSAPISSSASSRPAPELRRPPLRPGVRLLEGGLPPKSVPPLPLCCAFSGTRSSRCAEPRARKMTACDASPVRTMKLAGTKSSVASSEQTSSRKWVGHTEKHCTLRSMSACRCAESCRCRLGGSERSRCVSSRTAWPSALKVMICRARCGGIVGLAVRTNSRAAACFCPCAVSAATTSVAMAPTTAGYISAPNSTISVA